MPRQLTNRGDRLVFSNGIIFLGIASSALVIAFGGNVGALIPLYAVGVFTGFTLSQFGMLVHHRSLKKTGWQVRAFFSGLGASTTFLVVAVVVVTKFTDGAWITAVVIPMMIMFFLAVNRHYKKVRSFLQIEEGYIAPRRTHTVLVLVGSVNKGVLQAVKYAESLRPDRLLALSVVGSTEEREKLESNWAKYGMTTELETLNDDFRNLTDTILTHINRIDNEDSDDIITVVIPEFVTALRSQWLHNQSALAIKARLLYRKNTVVTSVPIVIE